MKKPNIQYIAVKALIKNDRGEAFVLKQSDSTISGGDKYHPPGGIVELGESLEDCVVREVKEEIGVQAEVIGIVDVGEWYAERGSDVMQFVGLFYECRITDDNFALQSSEVSEAVWVAAQDLDDIEVVEPSKSIIKKFLTR